MKNCYIDYDYRAVADLCDYYNCVQIITRINVPKEHRGKGVGSKLLRQIVSDADVSHTKLYLEVLASGGLTRPQLIAWYERYGFTEIGHTGVWRRLPTR
jgi:GNAT superfamily N-acetyltransferase